MNDNLASLHTVKARASHTKLSNTDYENSSDVCHRLQHEDSGADTVQISYKPSTVNCK